MRNRRRVTKQITSNVSAPNAAVMVRMLNGGMSSSAIFITGQIVPQSKHCATSRSLARMSPASAAVGF
jgi:hypothetical protein